MKGRGFSCQLSIHYSSARIKDLDLYLAALAKGGDAAVNSIHLREL